MFSLAQVRSRLQDCPAELADPGGRPHAAVALVICASDAGPEILFIERTEHEGDPWSGHLGFPGGRLEAGDAGPREAAERETWEETGLELVADHYLGRIDDLEGAHVPIVISCFVFGLARQPPLTLNQAEVRDAFWVPVAQLLDPDRRREKTFRFRGEGLTYPAIQLLPADRPLLWGITYRLAARFLEVLGRPLGGGPARG